MVAGTLMVSSTDSVCTPGNYSPPRQVARIRCSALLCRGRPALGPSPWRILVSPAPGSVQFSASHRQCSPARLWLSACVVSLPAAAFTGADTRTYERHKPENTLLYRIVAEHLETFLAEAREKHERGLPDYVEKELREYLKCGILANGFLRARCRSCGKSMLVAHATRSSASTASLRRTHPGERRWCRRAPHATAKVRGPVDRLRLHRLRRLRSRRPCLPPGRDPSPSRLVVHAREPRPLALPQSAPCMRLRTHFACRRRASIGPSS